MGAGKLKMMVIVTTIICRAAAFAHHAHTHTLLHSIVTADLQGNCYRTDPGRGVVGEGYTITERTPLSFWGRPHLLGSPCPPPEERRLSMPDTGEKERNYLFKSYTDLE